MPGHSDADVIRTGPFCDFEQHFPELVAVNAEGSITGQTVDFCRPSHFLVLRCLLTVFSLLGTTRDVEHVHGFRDRQ